MAKTDSNAQAGSPQLEVLRVVRLCHPHWESLSRVTYRPQKTDPVWAGWRDEIFLPVVYPALQAMRLSSATGDRQGLMARDRGLDEGLPAEAGARSRRAGHALMKAFPAAPGEKLWRHFGVAMEEGKTPGHLAAVLAVRAAAFHVAPALLTAAYAYMEARSGLGDSGVTQWMAMSDDCVRASAKQGATGLRAA